MSQALHPMLNTAVKAARAAGALINRAALDIERVQVTAKSHNDFVTEVDQAAEAAIIETLLTAYPEGHVDAADSQVVLVRVDPSLLRDDERADWSPDGLLAFSKVCTHAGCPVGLYEAQRHELLCPCHQSAFDVLQRCKPVFGPAAVELPQLPIAVGDDGTLHATGDFSAPVGPSFWHRA